MRDPARAPADDLLRRAHALRRRSSPTRRSRRATELAAARLHLGGRGAAAARRRALARALSASTSSTASARPRCCTSSSPTVPATCATAPRASPVPGYELELVDDDGQRVARRRGWARCGCAARPLRSATGTSASRAARRSTAPGRAPATSYVRDADGYYTYCGRADDMLKVGGIWVSPFEVECALAAHAAVLEAAVVGARRTRTG